MLEPVSFADTLRVPVEYVLSVLLPIAYVEMIRINATTNVALMQHAICRSKFAGMKAVRVPVRKFLPIPAVALFQLTVPQPTSRLRYGCGSC